MRNAVDQANKKLYGNRGALHFPDRQVPQKEGTEIAVCNNSRVVHFVPKPTTHNPNLAVVCDEEQVVVHH